MPWIRAIGTAVPEYSVGQDEARALAEQHFGSGRTDAQRLLQVFDNVLVNRRFFCVPPEWFRSEHSFAERNDLFAVQARRLSRDAIQSCLDQAGLAAHQVDHILFLSSSGVATPSLDAHLLQDMGFQEQIRRTPIFGLGCGGGGAGLALAGQLARAEPSQRILLVAVELSSLTFQPQDFSKSNFVASSLFSDGAAAVLVEGDAAPSHSPAVELLASRSVTLPGTLDVMGWEFGQTGMRVIFSKAIPALLRKHLRSQVDRFLDDSKQRWAELRHFVLHPGGARILEAFRDVLGVTEAQLENSRFVLENYGNMSAPTVLFILKRLIQADPLAGTGLLASFGPGFSAEMLLFRIA